MLRFAQNRPEEEQGGGEALSEGGKAAPVSEEGTGPAGVAPCSEQ